MGFCYEKMGLNTQDIERTIRRMDMVDLSTQMEMFMKDNELTTKQMAKEGTFTLTGQCTMGTEKMISKMDLEKNAEMMAVITVGTTQMDSRMASVSSIEVQTLITKVNFTIITSTAKGFIIEKMVEFIMDNEKTTKCMDMANSRGRMAGFI